MLLCPVANVSKCAQKHFFFGLIYDPVMLKLMHRNIRTLTSYYVCVHVNIMYMKYMTDIYDAYVPNMYMQEM